MTTRFLQTRLVFSETREFLVKHRLELTAAHGDKQLREGASTVLKADLLAEQRLVPSLCQLWQGVPVLCEEAEHSDLLTTLPGISLLAYHDDVKDLPDDCMSVDGLDGSALYANGELSLVAMSAGLIQGGQPVAGIVMMLDSGETSYSGFTSECLLVIPYRKPWRPLKDCLIGLDDNKAVDPDFRTRVISRLMGHGGFRYPLNVPSVAGAIKVLYGNLAAYVTSNARHWDIAGTAAICLANGKIVRCLDGSPVPWNQVRMPPVVFARDEETFEYVQKVCGY